MVALNGLVEDCIMNVWDEYYERNAQNDFSKKNRSLLMCFKQIYMTLKNHMEV